MTLATKGVTKKTFISANEAITWAGKQYTGKGLDNEEELARFRLIAGNVPKDFWNTKKYIRVEARFDGDGALNEFHAIDKDNDSVRTYP